MKLSYSATSKYQTCPKMYHNHYNLRLRSKYAGSPLWWGGAVDDAMSYLLLSKKKELTESEKILRNNVSAKHILLTEMSSINLNGNIINPKTSEFVVYSKSDWQLELLTEENKAELKHIYDYGNDIDKVMLACHKGEHKHLEAYEMYRACAWMCLYNKGCLILDEYEEKIMPQIEEVYSVQEKVELPDGAGNTVIGYIDFTCKFFADPNKYIVDNKTASKPYKQSELDESRQLHTYAEYKGYTHIAYIVAEKNIRKREPRVRINILTGTVNEDTLDLTFGEYSDTLEGIEAGNFDMTDDTNKCKMQFGKPCIYYELCHYNKFNGDILEKVK